MEEENKQNEKNVKENETEETTKTQEVETKKKKVSIAVIIIPIVIILMIVLANVLSNGGMSNISNFNFEEFIQNIKKTFSKGSRDFEKSIGDIQYKVSSESKNVEEKSKVAEKTEQTEKKTQSTQKTTPTPEPAKTSINAGGYTLQFGTYKGQMVQGVWDEETMTSTAVYYDVVLKLTENTITLDGETVGYTVIGTELRLNGRDYMILEATGNNRITYYAETCPELVYQGY